MPTNQEKTNFYKTIEKIVVETDLNWIEAITHHCSVTGLEIEVASTLVNQKLKKKLTEVAIAKNFLKKTNKLNV